MIAVIYRYRLILLIAAIILAALIAWFAFAREDRAKEPLKGVYVYGEVRWGQYDKVHD
jgi:hypothetical protein